MLKITLIDDLNVAIVKLPQGVYKVDGTEIDVPYNSSPLQVTDHQGMLRKRTYNNLTGYLNNATGGTITKKEYIAGQAPAYEEDGDDYEAIYQYRKYQDAHTAQYDSGVAWDKVDVQVIKAPLSTGSEYITAMWSTSDKIDMHHLCTLSVLGCCADEFDKVAAEYDLTTDKANHSGIYYHKVEHSFVFTTDDRFSSKMTPTYKGTFEGCKEKEKYWRGVIRSKMLALSCVQRKLMKASDFDIDLLMEGLSSIRRNLSEVKSHQKTTGSLRSARSSVAELTTYIDGLAVKVLEERG